MAFEITVTEQMLSFLYALLFGAFIAAFYDVFRFLRAFAKYSEQAGGKGQDFNKKIYYVTIFIQDIIYFVLISVMFSIFLYGYNYGQISVYILLAVVVGFITYIKTIGVLTASVFDMISKIMRLLANAVKYKILKPGCIFISGRFKKIINMIAVMRIKNKNRRRCAVLTEQIIIDY